jgi:hypothetical protein
MALATSNTRRPDITRAMIEELWDKERAGGPLIQVSAESPVLNWSPDGPPDRP